MLTAFSASFSLGLLDEGQGPLPMADFSYLVLEADGTPMGGVATGGGAPGTALLQPSSTLASLRAGAEVYAKNYIRDPNGPYNNQEPVRFVYLDDKGLL